MSTPIETKAPKANTINASTTTSNNSTDPDPGCCTVPPETDPGPIKG